MDLQSYTELHCLQIYLNHTGQDIKKIEEYLDRDSFMGPDEAKDFGLIDKIVKDRKEIDT